MATVENLHDLTNRRAMYEIPVKPADEKQPVKIPVTILGHRVAYGRIELLVSSDQRKRNVLRALPFPGEETKG
jgi:hypothetical protein